MALGRGLGLDADMTMSASPRYETRPQRRRPMPIAAGAQNSGGCKVSVADETLRQQNWRIHVPEDVLEIVRVGRQLTVAGELDMLTARTFTEAVDVLVQEALMPITIEASAMTFCDSSGIACLLRARKQVEVIIINPRPRLLDLLELVGIASDFTITGTTAP
jgi:anti-anti-sigma factor